MLVFPDLFRHCAGLPNVGGLAPLRSSDQQDDDDLAPLNKVKAVSRPEGQPRFKKSTAQWLDIAQAYTKLGHSNRNPAADIGVF
ncbi:MAG: hypothetical protein V2J26_06400 [Pacificimonas sp.]|jgi:hypothetical protein|nr:hypothetical protein [Pacificimonas sp.]